MHYHLEIIMPPTDDVEGQVANIMFPFSEYETDHEDHSGHAFWDWYVIGGRWAGEHLRALVDADKLSRFHDELKERKVTVSGLQCGKQTLEPASQVPMVDELWRAMFPESELKACPLFSHFNDQYKDNCLDADTFDNVTEHLKASRLIVAGPSWDDAEKFQAEFMIEDSIWNGVSHVDTTWNGNVLEAVKMHHEETKNYSDEYREKMTIRDDWLVVTVDYHS